MVLEAEKLSENLGVHVKGLDAGEPLDETTRKALYRAWVEHSVLLLRDQDMIPEQFVEFARQFGKPIEQNLKHLNVPGCPELAFISSDDRDIHGTGRKSIYVNTVRSERALDVDDEESNALLDELFEQVDQPQFQYRHQWQPGDVLLWDNRSVLHKANADYEGKRFLYRSMVEGEKPI